MLPGALHKCSAQALRTHRNRSERSGRSGKTLRRQMRHQRNCMLGQLQHKLRRCCIHLGQCPGQHRYVTSIQAENVLLYLVRKRQHETSLLLEVRFRKGPCQLREVRPIQRGQPWKRVFSQSCKENTLCPAQCGKSPGYTCQARPVEARDVPQTNVSKGSKQRLVLFPCIEPCIGPRQAGQLSPGFARNMSDSPRSKGP